MTLRNPSYYGRLFGTFLSFTLFGLGGLMMSVTIFPLLYILPIGKERRVYWARYFMRGSFRFFIRFMRAVGAVSYEFHGVETLRDRKGLFIVANHPTLLDVVFLVSLSSLPNCVVKQAVWKNPFMFFLVKSAGFIESNNDPEVIIDQCEQALRSGDGLILFPEGTRTDPDGEIVMKRGVAHVALRAAKNLTPVRITCSPISLTKKHRWYNIPLEKPPHFCIEVGEDVDIKQFLSADGDRSHDVRSLTEELKKAFVV